MRLGDLDALFDRLMGVLYTEHQNMRAILSQQSTIDAVPVVRCCDCEKRDKDFVSAKGTISCPYMEAFMPPDGFCSYGERKDGDTDARTT